MCSWILVHQQMHDTVAGVSEATNRWLHHWFGSEPVMSGYDGLGDLDAFRWFLLAMLLVAALLMVSTVRFPHLGNTLLGRMSFRKLILLMAVGAIFVWKPAPFLVVAISCYLLYGLGSEAWLMWRSYRSGRNPLDDDDDADDAGVGGERPDDVGPAPGR